MRRWLYGLLESYDSKKDSLGQYDVLVPLETPYGETTGGIQFWSDATKNGQVGSAHAGLAFRAPQVPPAPTFSLV